MVVESSDGSFLVKSLFQVLSIRDTKLACAKWIWNHHIPTMVQFFAWQLLHIGILTERTLKHRGFHIASCCSLCEEENVWQLFFDCSDINC